MAKAKAKSKPARSNASFLKKIVKQHNTSARGPAVQELDAMLTFLLQRFNGTVDCILQNYDKTSETIKAKVAQAAWQLLLTGDLRDVACDAGAEAVNKFLEKNKAAAAKKKEKASAAAAAGGDAEAA